MKKSILILLFLALKVAGISQVGTVSFTNNSVIYKNDEVLMMAAISNFGCEQIYLHSGQGKIEHFPNCHYIFHPNVVGPAKIHIYYLKDGDTILTAVQTFEIYERPVPKSEIGGRSRGEVSKEFLTKGQLKGLNYSHSNKWAAFSIVSFDVVVTRDRKIISFHNNPVGDFDNELRSVLESLLPGDRVAFINILGDREVGNVYVSNMEFTIK